MVAVLGAGVGFGIWGSSASGSQREDVPEAPKALSEEEWRDLARLADDAELASWLLDDDIKWNAMAAGRELWARIEDPLRYRGAASVLWPLMDLDDAQAVDLAAGLLQEACMTFHPGLPTVTPDDRLLAYTVREALGYEGYLSYSYQFGASSPIGAVRFCILYAREVRPWVVASLRTPLVFTEQEMYERYLMYGRVGERWLTRDREMHSFMAAYLLSFAPGAVPIEEVVEAIVPRLKCNWTNYDALMGMAALGRYGPAAAGPCRRALETSTDDQQRACLELLLAHWDWPEGSALREEAVERFQQAGLTWKVRNPVVEWHFELQVW